MKKLVLLSAALFMFSFAAFSQTDSKSVIKPIPQDRKNAIGVRVGWGGEISYQRFLTRNNRLELGTGWGRYGFDLSGVYQWMWPLTDGNVGFNWYAGAGASFGAWENKHDSRKFGFGVLGQIGIEYNLKNAPFVFSIDWRPNLHLAPDTHFGWEGFALGARYRF